MTGALAIIELADELQREFQPFLWARARRAGWDSDDMSQLCLLAAAEALRGYDAARGGLLPRAYFCLVRAAARETRGYCGRGLDASAELATLPGGDDPASVLQAGDNFARLQAAGLVAAAMEAEVGPARSRRRRREKLRDAAIRFLQGDALQVTA